MLTQGTPYTIRHAKITDWPDLYTLMRGFFTELSHKQLSYYIYMTTYRNNLLILSEHKKFAGMIGYNQQKSDSIWIDYLIVHSDHRKKGFAAKLLEHLIDQCARHGIKKLMLAVFKNNQPAIQLYKKCGFNYAHDEPKKIILSMEIKSHDNPSYKDRRTNPNFLQKIFFRTLFYIIRLFN